MITIKEWMELVDYKITEGSDYGWDCYGPYSYSLSSWNGIHGQGGYSFNIVFSTKSQKVYEVEVCDYTNDRAYRMIRPSFVEKHKKESLAKGFNLNKAWDDVKFIDIDVVEDFMEKARAIKQGKEYDTRLQVELKFDNEELLKYMTIAHQEDITFNQLIERALSYAIEEAKAGRLTKDIAQEYVKNQKI